MEEPKITLTESCLACLATNRIMESVDEFLAERKICEMLKTLFPSSIVGDNGIFNTFDCDL